MALIDNADQVALAESVRSLVAAHAPMSVVREVLEDRSGYSSQLWSRLADLGIAGLLVPEEYGGAGGSLADLAAALRELGSALVPTPLLPSTLAAVALMGLDDPEAKAEYLPLIASGALIATLATSEPGHEGWIGAHPTTRAEPNGDHARISGTKRAVVCAERADVLLVHARDDRRNGLYVVLQDAPGLDIVREDGIDQLRTTATVTFDRTPARPLTGDADGVLDQISDLAAALVACSQSAAMLRALEVTTDYAKDRFSFGQPIGSYQGVKHRLADIYADWCLVDALARRAIEATDQGHAEAASLSRAARLLASPAYVNAARQMMMLHGGIGFTWEHDAHLYFRNAVSDSLLFGSAAYQRARLADLLGA